MRTSNAQDPAGRRTGDVERALADLATRRHGVLDLAELRGCGLSASAIKRRVAAGRLRRLHPGVYAVGHTALTGEGRLRAAVLACGPDAVLSHASAAALLDLRATRSAKIDVTTPHRGGRSSPRGVRLHRVPGLGAVDITAVRGLPVTTAARTLFDLAGVLTAAGLHRALGQAEVQRLDVGVRLRELLELHPRRAGTVALREALARGVAQRETRSQLEARMDDLCARAGLTRPALNRKVLGLEVDFLWQERRLIVEIDTFRYHGTPTAFETDRRRDARLLAAGYRVLRITDRRLQLDQEEVISLLRGLLS